MTANFNSPSAINHITGITDTIRYPVPYSLISGPRWIYCNYPELIPSAALGDARIGNRYLNRVLVNGEAELFVSYRNMSGYSIYFGVQLYNPNPGKTVNVTVENRAFHVNGSSPTQDWNWVVGQTPVDFINSTTKTMLPPIGSYKSAWIIKDQGPISNGNLFNSYVRFSTEGEIYCFPYVYTSIANITGRARLYPWTSSSTYRGHGTTCFINSTFTIRVSQMPFSYASNSCSYNSGADIIQIIDQGAAWNCSSPNRNLGNWGAHYFYNITIHNDTDTNKTIDAHIGTETNNLTPIIKYDGAVHWVNLNNKRWNWLTESGLAPGVSKTYNIEYIQGAQSNSPSIHSWTAS